MVKEESLNTTFTKSSDSKDMVVGTPKLPVLVLPSLKFILKVVLTLSSGSTSNLDCNNISLPFKATNSLFNAGISSPLKVFVLSNSIFSDSLDFNTFNKLLLTNLTETVSLNSS